MYQTEISAAEMKANSLLDMGHPVHDAATVNSLIVSLILFRFALLCFLSAAAAIAAAITSAQNHHRGRLIGLLVLFSLRLPLSPR